VTIEGPAATPGLRRFRARARARAREGRIGV